MPCGQVVKYHGDLFVVVDSSYDWQKKRYDRFILIPFNHSNSSTHVSREHPFMTSKCTLAGGEDECCSCEPCESCEYCEKVIDEDFSIDKVKFVADNVKEFVNRKFNKIFLEE